VKGQPMTFAAKGTVTEAVSAATFSLVVAWNNVSDRSVCEIVVGCFSPRSIVVVVVVVVVVDFWCCACCQFPLYSHSGNSCGNTTIELPMNVGTLTLAGLSCPLTANGPMDISIGVGLPSSVPSGAYDIKLKGNAGSDEIYCIDGSFNL
jgi:hypothetical protein